MTDNKNVRVALRIRPLVPSETSKGCMDVLEVFKSLEQVRIKGSDRAFTFNFVFGPLTTQDDVYTRSVQDLVQNLFQGYNLTILAYGQTGSGKTYSMGTTFNGQGEMGVIPRIIQDVFNNIQNSFTYDFNVSVSFMELYQETLFDLLSDKQRDQCVLEIREDYNKEIIIPGLTEVTVTDTKEVFEALKRGSLGRATGSTNMNAQSSRSHAIFTINLCMRDRNNSSETKTAKLHLVDLAGSERPKKTGAVGNTFKEGVNINKGLLVLGNVISALGDDKQHSYIPYRDSNLTRLLKDSLGGNSITLMIACVSPADYNLDETMSTLRYADRARKIQNKPVVNQDPKAAEIKQLKDTIKQLNLQIMGQGGPLICPAEIELLKKECTELRSKIRGLTLQLSSTLNDNTGLLEKIIILQNANEQMSKKIQELKDEYNLTLNNISLGLDHNDLEAVKKNLTKLQHIQEQFVDIDTEQKRTDTEISNHERKISLTGPDVIEDHECHETHTNKQMALNMELQVVTKELAIKEHLARQIATNAQYMVDYQAMAESEAKILSLQKEKDELLQQLKSVHVQGNSGKIAEQRRKRVQVLETQIQDLNKKVQEQSHLIRLKAKDEQKIKTLHNDIVQMKQLKVKLIRTMREESEKFKLWKQERERELAKLKQLDRKKQNQIVKMEAMHSKQQNVLKRKVEEAAAMNKRLKDALALRKNAQDTKYSGKIDKLGSWLKQEFDVYVHLVEAETTLKGLLEDRATLKQQLDMLKSNPETADSTEARSIEEDIEMRSDQIQDLQQKLMDSDEDCKNKGRFDNIQTMAEAKCALKLIFEMSGEIKKNEVMTQAKFIDAQANQMEIMEQKNELEKILKVVEYKHAGDLAELEKEYEEKVSVLLKQLRGVEVKSTDESLKQRCAIQEDKIENLEANNQKLMAEVFLYQQQVEALTKKLDVNLAQQAQPGVLEKVDDNIQRFLTPEARPRKIRVNRMDTTYTMTEMENVDGDLEDEIDNYKEDPDWRRTPVGKWLMEKRSKGNRTLLEECNRKATKRTSDGGCMCTKSNCNNRCGCKKVNKSCSTSCKCSVTLCANRLETVENGEGDSSCSEQSTTTRDTKENFKKPRNEADNNIAEVKAKLF